jgi:hypothetical protein
MTLSSTSPESLAEVITQTVGRPVEYAPIPTDGAHLAAKIILDRAEMGSSPERPALP